MRTEPWSDWIAGISPVAVAFDWFDDESREHIELATAAEREELAVIRGELVADGMTDDGAIVVRIAV